MGPKDPIYYCQTCKKLTLNLEDLLFVEDNSSRSFCSEDCIENQYQHLVNFYETWEKQYRKKNDLGSEDVLALVGKSNYMDRAFSKPEEVWLLENHLGEKVYSFIKSFDEPEFGKFTFCSLCFVFDGRPSFILFASATRNDAFISEFRIGEHLKDFSLSEEHGGLDETQREMIDVDENTLMAVENKKSTHLALMLEERSPADIPFEAFTLYDSYFEVTMKDPDEIYHYKDDEGDPIKTYIKAFEKDGTSFYFFIICLQYEKYRGDDNEALIPILSFPTLDGDMYRLYKKGDLISGNLKN